MSEFARLTRDFGWRIDQHASLEQGVWKRSAERAVSYPAGGHTWCAALEDESYWFAHRNRQIVALLRRHGLPPALWDVGAGNGKVAHHLQSAGLETVAVEPEWPAARRAAERGVHQAVCAFFEDLQLPGASIPAAGCFDVIEHMSDPLPLLREIHRTLMPGGLLAVTVPALQLLWSEVDIISGHYRRYRPAELDALMRTAGYEGRARYMMAVLVLPALLFRTVPFRRGRRTRSTAQCLADNTRYLTPRARVIDRALRGILGIEHGVSRLVPLPFGTSCIGVYTKHA